MSSQPPASHIDLRKSLLQLQAIGAEARLLKSVPSEPSLGEEANASSSIRDVSRVAADLSYADAELERRASVRIEVGL